MGHAGTGGQAGQCCAAGVAEQVEHLDGTVGSLDLFLVPGPVHSLLREDAGMLKAGGADDQRQVLPFDVPLLGQLFVVVPLAAALSGTVIDGVCPGPQGADFLVFPDDLRVGADEQRFAPAFQAVMIRCVDQLVIDPGIGGAHQHTPGIRWRII